MTTETFENIKYICISGRNADEVHRELELAMPSDLYRRQERILFLSGLHDRYPFSDITIPDTMKLVVLYEDGPILTDIIDIASRTSQGEDVHPSEVVDKVFCGDRYRTGLQKNRVIRELTESNLIDFVAIQNNTGIGVEKAGMVHPALRREKSLIFWNYYIRGDEQPYAQLGYTQFMSSTDLRLFFEGYLSTEQHNLTP